MDVELAKNDEGKMSLEEDDKGFKSFEEETERGGLEACSAKKEMDSSPLGTETGNKEELSLKNFWNFAKSSGGNSSGVLSMMRIKL